MATKSLNCFLTGLLIVSLLGFFYVYATSTSGVLAKDDTIIDTTEYSILIPAGFRYQTIQKPDGGVEVRAKNASLDLRVTGTNAARNSTASSMIEKLKSILLRKNSSWRFSSMSTHLEGKFQVSKMTATTDNVQALVAALTAPGKLYVVQLETSDTNIDDYHRMFNKVVQSLHTPD